MKTASTPSRNDIIPYLLCALLCLLPLPLWAEATFPSEDPTEGWPEGIEAIEYLSKADDSLQPAMLYAAPTTQSQPLLVNLHSWSGDYRQPLGVPFAEWCIRHEWHYIHPNFRGGNWRPGTMGSQLVVDDILSAVAYTTSTLNVDPDRIYLVGMSGGGYASLLIAGKYPHLWAAVSSWVPILDLAEWYNFCERKELKYARHMRQVVGGDPGHENAYRAELRRRSARPYLKNAQGLTLELAAGIQDGWQDVGCVPTSHTLHAFNILAAPEDRLSEDEITSITQTATIPTTLSNERVDDPTYSWRRVLFRRRSEQVRVTIFEGEHEMSYNGAAHWLALQRRGEPMREH